MKTVDMRKIHREMIKANHVFIRLIEGFGYLYQSGTEMFVYNGKEGLRKL